MATEWYPLPRFEKPDTPECLSQEDCPHAPGEIDILWNKFLHSSLGNKERTCQCQQASTMEAWLGTTINIPFRLKPIHPPGTSKQSYSPVVETNLANALATSKPQFLKQSQFRVRMVKANRGGQTGLNEKFQGGMQTKSKKVWHTKLTQQEQLIQTKRKAEAHNNRLRVKLFQKEVLNKLKKDHVS